MLKYKRYIILFSFNIIFNLLISLLYLVTNISYNFISTILIINYLITFMFLNFMLAKKSKQKGIIFGLEVGIISIIMLLILSFIFRCNFDVKNIIYYLLVLLSSIFGSILSKNVKR